MQQICAACCVRRRPKLCHKINDVIGVLSPFKALGDFDRVRGFGCSHVDPTIVWVLTLGLVGHGCKGQSVGDLSRPKFLHADFFIPFTAIVCWRHKLCGCRYVWVQALVWIYVGAGVRAGIPINMSVAGVIVCRLKCSFCRKCSSRYKEFFSSLVIHIRNRDPKK